MNPEPLVTQRGLCTTADTKACREVKQTYLTVTLVKAELGGFSFGMAMYGLRLTTKSTMSVEIGNNTFNLLTLQCGISM